ncbi:hypothetical protein ETB97_005264 [Aspergillus alliaceus]|uniref:Uncharacterized protein n=1 Tax=Petromyces alliaceus TaxID=209559 RepID=A0A8H5ZYX2_PETAA|nr:hypothetical protein ETB97_005264 [Aspergillus burnettii]
MGNTRVVARGYSLSIIDSIPMPIDQGQSLVQRGEGEHDLAGRKGERTESQNG